MTKRFLSALFACFLLLSGAAHAEKLKLPEPDTKGGRPLMQSLAERKSSRVFAARPLSDKLLGDMLWAACGVNRPGGKRTIPTAQNRQDLEIYVLRSTGAWLYNAPAHTLELVASRDLRPLLNGTGFVREAPVGLVYVTDTRKNGKELYAAMHAGSAYQNVGLFCASVGLHNVVRASYNAEGLAKALSLPPEKRILITQSVGWDE